MEDVNAGWERKAEVLPRRLAAAVENIQLLRRFAEDARRDARQWAAQSGEEDPKVDVTDLATFDAEERGNERLHTPDDIGSATRVIDVLRIAIGCNQITAGSDYGRSIVQQMCEFQQASVESPEGLFDTVVHERR